MSDACCVPADAPGSGDTHTDDGPARLWQVRELQRAGLAAVLLGAARLVDLSGGPGVAVVGLELVAATVAASTFVPGALRNLRHGRIGVGTLMTIAAVGAVGMGGGRYPPPRGTHLVAADLGPGGQPEDGERVRLHGVSVRSTVEPAAGPGAGRAATQPGARCQILARGFPPGPRRRERPPRRAPARAVTCAPARARLPTWAAGPAATSAPRPGTSPSQPR